MNGKKTALPVLGIFNLYFHIPLWVLNWIRPRAQAGEIGKVHAANSFRIFGDRRCHFGARSYIHAIVGIQ